ncbi:hypothetical protein RB195_020206 [Necator americanus]|uniref:Uncharacterized protein n=1 Tax=Necator americanus TaxID=51031 RepID=A0ABR1CK51_NECAM
MSGASKGSSALRSTAPPREKSQTKRSPFFRKRSKAARSKETMKDLKTGEQSSSAVNKTKKAETAKRKTNPRSKNMKKEAEQDNKPSSRSLSDGTYEDVQLSAVPIAKKENVKSKQSKRSDRGKQASGKKEVEQKAVTTPRFSPKSPALTTKCRAGSVTKDTQIETLDEENSGPGRSDKTASSLEEFHTGNSLWNG